MQAGFVSAVLKAGFHIELAGGGHYNEKRLRNKVDEITRLVDQPGVGITLNSLYINQRQWTFQLPLWQQMKKEGLPIEGLCVAAGIPSTEKAKEIIDGLRDAGIKHVSFKPGVYPPQRVRSLELTSRNQAPSMAFVKSAKSPLQTLTTLSFFNGPAAVQEVTTAAKTSMRPFSPLMPRFDKTQTSSLSEVPASVAPMTRILT